MMDYPYFESGRFYVGCNYWASHAGTYMWRNWRPEIVRQDFEMMAKAGLKSGQSGNIRTRFPAA